MLGAGSEALQGLRPGDTFLVVGSAPCSDRETAADAAAAAATTTTTTTGKRSRSGSEKGGGGVGEGEEPKSMREDEGDANGDDAVATDDPSPSVESFRVEAVRVDVDRATGERRVTVTLATPAPDTRGEASDLGLGGLGGGEAPVARGDGGSDGGGAGLGREVWVGRLHPPCGPGAARVMAGPRLALSVDLTGRVQVGDAVTVRLIGRGLSGGEGEDGECEDDESGDDAGALSIESAMAGTAVPGFPAADAAAAARTANPALSQPTPLPAFARAGEDGRLLRQQLKAVAAKLRTARNRADIVRLMQMRNELQKKMQAEEVDVHC
jgi:hypothetical protein